MDAQYSPRRFDGSWGLRFPGQISGQHVTAEPLTDGVIELEGEQLHAIELGHTDTDGTSALHVPSTGLVVAGDAVYGEVHVYLAEAKGSGTQEWLGALDAIERLGPSAVVAGHKRDGDADSPESSAEPAATSKTSPPQPRRPAASPTSTRQSSPSTPTG